MEKRPEVRMQKPIVHKPKPKIPEPIKKPIPAVRTTLRATPKPMHRTGPTPRPTPRPRKTMKKVPSPNPWANLNMNSTNLLYDPAKPSPKVKLDSSKLFQKMKELQEMLKGLKQSRKRNTSMNASAKAYLNRASYEDPLFDNSDNRDNSLKLTGIKGTALR